MSVSTPSEIPHWRTEGEPRSLPRMAATRMGETFLIAAGGTGGHVMPALEVARELVGRGHQCVFVGTRRGMERRLVPAAGFPLEIVDIGPLNRVPLLTKLQTLAQAPLSVVRALGLIRKFRPPAVLSLGGYTSGPLAAAAVLSGVPVIAMEPNAYPGLANRLAARWVKRALLGFSGADKYFPQGRTETIGVPVRREFFELPRKQHVGSPTILVTGGSQGSRALNDAAVAAAKKWARDGFPGGLRILHQTGTEQYNNVSIEYQLLKDSSEIDLEAVAFIDDMPAAFARADLVVCRSGASAVAELAAAGKASILVPLATATDDHQRSNAQAMVSAGASRLVVEREWCGERMAAEVGAVLGAPGRLEKMEEAARSLARPEAAAAAASALLETAGEGT